MSVINRNSFAKALKPGVNKWYGEGYGEYPLQSLELFTQETSTDAFEQDVGISGFGLLSSLGEGEGVSYDSMRQGYVTTYSHIKYGLGFIITQEMMEDGRYMTRAKKGATALGLSVRQTQETVAANVYNRATNTSYVGGDGKELLATDHPNASGGTFANELATAADLSEAALEQAAIDIKKLTNDRGLKIPIQIVSLIIPVDLTFEAERILKSPLQVNSAENNVNVLKMAGTIPKIVSNNFLTDADQWFLRTNCPDGMKRFVRKAVVFSEDNDFDTDNLKYKAVYRESYGWTDPRGIFGSPGA